MGEGHDEPLPADMPEEALRAEDEQNAHATFSAKDTRMNRPLKEAFAAGKGHLGEMRAALESLFHVAGLVGSAELRDLYLLRFLMASKYNVSDAVEKFRTMVAFRERHRMDEVRKKFEEGSMKYWEIPGFKEHFACCPDTFRLVSGCAKDGSPVAIAGVTRWDYDAYYKLDEALENSFQMYHMEFMLLTLDKMSLSTGKLCGNVKILDLDGVTLAQRSQMKINDQHRKQRYERLGANLEFCYPELASKICIVNSPSFVTILWWTAKMFLPQRVIDKVLIVRKHDTKTTLLSLVDASVLPSQFGGTFSGAWEMGKIDYTKL
mmetsp:Transcript_9133/g.22851  ORF Transcript_9133/g.22851 Transcript_9133/m.22851 type:complete len:320 (+) Transcript_9133:193-1152(+)|eukprot:CAMPEP_0206236204 /NCGR_PEP_ID=MMETSP0047_2-20121206/13581_1 /ASSEMBLY_ACC=CAM_ASM_000192 /TAXON_ID=195065 /ORGANISM="Chroomonas mesostigmatica_cf, Strain CCMP1168" /LENGTH=319 /DNA_ID=CAMNT_0053660505 /DNA_START=193 /DNA_END=1152 /DNA_ORIENTATION=+